MKRFSFKKIASRFSDFTNKNASKMIYTHLFLRFCSPLVYSSSDVPPDLTALLSFLTTPVPSTMIPRPCRPLPSFPNPKSAHRKAFYSRYAGRRGGAAASPGEVGATTISHDFGGEGGVGRDTQEGGKQLVREEEAAIRQSSAAGERGGGAAALPGERGEASMLTMEGEARTLTIVPPRIYRERDIPSPTKWSGTPRTASVSSRPSRR